MQEEFPGLLSRGFNPIGKYGIGFFSVFMIGDFVQVITRRSDAGARDTLVLEFSSGLGTRPILRPATKQERLMDAGTHVKLKLRRDPRGNRGLLSRSEEGKALTLAELCSRIAPALEVDLFVQEHGKEEKVIAAYDWQTIAGERLLARMVQEPKGDVSYDELHTFRERAGANLQLIRGDNGEILGRALVTIGFGSGDRLDEIELGGVVTVGGLASCGLTGISGILGTV